MWQVCSEKKAHWRSAFEVWVAETLAALKRKLPCWMCTRLAPIWATESTTVAPGGVVVLKAGCRQCNVRLLASRSTNSQIRSGLDMSGNTNRYIHETLALALGLIVNRNGTYNDQITEGGCTILMKSLKHTLTTQWTKNVRHRFRTFLYGSDPY